MIGHSYFLANISLMPGCFLLSFLFAWICKNMTWKNKWTQYQQLLLLLLQWECFTTQWWLMNKMHHTNKLALFPSWEHLFVGEVDFLRSKTEENLFAYLASTLLMLVLSKWLKTLWDLINEGLTHKTAFLWSSYSGNLPAINLFHTKCLCFPFLPMWTQMFFETKPFMKLHNLKYLSCIQTESCYF